jgi:hypothetical protein
VDFVRRPISLHALGLLQVRYYCEPKRGSARSCSTALTFLRHLGDVGRLLIYLFRDEKTDNRALTMDVTGRNIRAVASSTVWLFLEAIDTHKLPPQWDTAYWRHAVRQASMIGFHHLEPGQVSPPPRQTC